MREYLTSYNRKGAIRLEITNNRTITLYGYESLPGNDKLLISFNDSNHKEVDTCRALMRNGKCSFDIPKHLPEGIYFIHIFVPVSSTLFSTEYSGSFFRSDLPMCYYRGKYQFINTVVYAPNKEYIENLRMPSLTSRKIEPQIRDLAMRVTRNLASDYDKILAVHDWVASYLFYDMDSLRDDSYKQNDHSPLGVLQSKRTVCQGYANLTVAMLTSIGIRSKVLSCFALGISTEGAWEKKSNLTEEHNHVIPIAYCGNRWVISDVTWDSNNEYVNGKFQKKNGGEVSHKYFDVTLEFISNSHKFTK